MKSLICRREVVVCIWWMIAAVACTPAKMKETATRFSPPAAISSLKPTVVANPCDRAMEAIPAFSENEKMMPKLFLFFQSYQQCMDGSIAKSMESVTVTTLAKNWTELADFADLILRDAGFKPFILNNINSSVTGQTAEVSQILEQSKKQCPQNHALLCKEIREAAVKALAAERKELEELEQAQD